MAHTLHSNRQSNIELLRILAAVAVIILHYNNVSIGGALDAAPAGSMGAYMLYFLEALCICAVDLFMMILGRFQIQKKEAPLSKVIILLMQVSIISIVFYIITTLISGKTIELAAIGRRALPSNYFIITYCAVLILSPYINKLFNSLKKPQRLVLILFILFSVVPALISILKDVTGMKGLKLIAISSDGSGSGYTFVNYAMMYIIGAMSSKMHLKKKHCILGLLCCLIPQIILTCLTYFPVPHLSHVLSYASPLVIGIAFFLLMLFSNFNLGVKPWINVLASGSLMVYLTHKRFFPLFDISHYASLGGGVTLVHLIVTVVLCYLAGWVISVIYGFLMKPVHKKITAALKKVVISSD